MKHTFIIIGSLLVTALLLRSAQAQDLGVPNFSGRPPDEHPILAPCTRYDDRYEALNFSDTYLEEWPDIYHERVDNIIEEYLQPDQVQCSSESQEEVRLPGQELKSLAASLPTWSDGSSPVGKQDTGRVLLEYLRVYECAMMEFEQALWYDTAREEFDKEGSPDFFDFFFSDLIRETGERSGTIQKERVIARKALSRALKLIGTLERLKPLDAELMCMQLFSIDVRNVAALSAETSACLPRIWNASDTLRDTTETTEK